MTDLQAAALCAAVTLHGVLVVVAALVGAWSLLSL